MKIKKQIVAAAVAAMILTAGIAGAADVELEKVGNDRIASDFHLYRFGERGVEHGEKVLAAAADYDHDRTTLMVYLAGNQFAAIDDLARAFISRFPECKPTQADGDGKCLHRGAGGAEFTFVTLPPGNLKAATLKGGWQTDAGKRYEFRPDVIQLLNHKAMRELADKDLVAGEDMVYLHNRLVLLVKEGDPKQIGVDGQANLARLADSNLKKLLPNPLKEGIMTDWLRPVLEKTSVSIDTKRTVDARMGSDTFNLVVGNGDTASTLFDYLTNGKQCAGCQTRDDVRFTTVHHREIPAAIDNGTADVGVVWAHEAQHAREEGHKVQGLELPDAQSRKNDMYYAAALARNGKSNWLAQEWLNFLVSPEAQEIFAKHGFTKMREGEGVMKPLPVAAAK